MSVKRDALKCKSYNSAAIESPTALPYTTNLLHDLLLSRPPAAAGIIAIKLWICCDVSKGDSQKYSSYCITSINGNFVCVAEGFIPCEDATPKNQGKEETSKGQVCNTCQIQKTTA